MILAKMVDAIQMSFGVMTGAAGFHWGGLIQGIRGSYKLLSSVDSGPSPADSL